MIAKVALHVFAQADAVPALLAWLDRELSIKPSDLGFLLIGPEDHAITNVAEAHGLKALWLVDAVPHVSAQDPVIVAGEDMNERISHLFQRGIRNVYDGNALLRQASTVDRFMNAAWTVFVGPTPTESRDIGAIEALRFPVDPIQANKIPGHKLFIVNSMPKSGTIWLIAMLERLLGVQGRQQIVLSHVADLEIDWCKPNNHGAILLARDIRDVVGSWFHHAMRSDLQMGFLEPRYPTIDAFYQEFFLGKIYGSDRYYRGDLEQWLDRAAASYVPIVKYEQLAADTAGVLAKILNAWRVRHDPADICRTVAACAPDAINATISHQQGYVAEMIRSGHVRKAVAGSWKEELPPDIAADVHGRFIGYQTRLGYQA